MEKADQARVYCNWQQAVFLFFPVDRYRCTYTEYCAVKRLHRESVDWERVEGSNASHKREKP